MRTNSLTLPALLALAIFSFLSSDVANGQTTVPKLTAGKWSAFAIAEGDSIPLTVDVAYRGDTLTLAFTMIPPDGSPPERATTRGIRHTADSLIFSIVPPDAGDNAIPCSLARQADKAYAGSCRGPDGDAARLRMAPPPTGDYPLPSRRPQTTPAPFRASRAIP